MKIKALLLAAAVCVAVIAGGCSQSDSNKNDSSSKASVSSETSDSSKEDSKKDDNSNKENSAQDSKDSSDKESSVPTGEAVDAAWFNDALFIGDSVTLKLSSYADTGDLGDAQFLCAGSLGYTNALWDIDHEDNVHPMYEGQQYTVDEGAKLIAPKKIFVMLGMNDIGLYGVDGAIESMKELTGKIKNNCPDSVIYIESVTPMIAGYSLGDLNNTSIAEFDEKLKTVCAENGFKYMDVASAVSDENGDLIYEYCSDIPTDDNPNGMGLHFTEEGCKAWADYLKANVNNA